MRYINTERGAVSEYNHTEIEQKWQKYWEGHKTFKADRPGKKKFYCLDMFPYPSGSGLHVGHPLGYTATDILCRYKRMCGYSVLHPMGFDAFGLPAEQHAVATGEHPASITKKNCEVFTKQLKMVGLSYDWDRNLATCTPDYYHWTQWIFLKLYNSWFDEKQHKARPIEELSIPDSVKKEGSKAVHDYQAEFRLAYYGEAMVNWCPALGTVLANEEVIDGRSERGGHEVIRKPMKQWLLRITKYAERLLSELEEIEWPESIKDQQRNWIGRKTGAEIEFKIKGRDKSLTAFTTRADTLFGVTFFVLSPEHPLVPDITSEANREAVEKYCIEAQKLSELARTIENRKKTGVFSGGFVINPINQEEVPIFIGDYVLMSVGTGAVMGVPSHDERDFEFARTFQIEIRPVIVPKDGDPARSSAVRDGEMAWIEPGVMLPCDAAVAKELKLEGKSNLEASELITAWLERTGAGRKVVNYKLRDWLFSRQRYWGEPIPIIHWEDGTSSALDESELPLELPQVEDYKPSEGGESPLAKALEWLSVIHPKGGMRGKRETNTMPQWAGSCWYYLRFIDPKNSKQGWDRELEKAWMPIDLYVGGAEHAVLHLLYSRFWHKVLFDLGYVSTREPFQKLFNQGMVLAYAYKNSRGALVPSDEVDEGEDGAARHQTTSEPLERIIAKMSKSLRNVVTLDETVTRYGADTFRMYLMFMGPLDVSRPWDVKAITGTHRFLKRTWTLVHDAWAKLSNGGVAEAPELTRAVHRLVKKVTGDIEGLHFNTAVSSMMEFLNLASGQPLSKESIEKFVLVLSPFAPHMAEELWSRLGHSKSLAYEKWPEYDPALITEQQVTVVVQVNGKKRATIDVDASISKEDLQEKIISQMRDTNYAVSGTDQFITVFQAGSSVPRLVNVVQKQA
ncbi:MAG: leucine--tRNA ligase [Proteobacteria bacterium]|nr:MAG: leucine--tRNA ligase [Pseudomonadota bacterium]